MTPIVGHRKGRCERVRLRHDRGTEEAPGRGQGPGQLGPPPAHPGHGRHDRALSQVFPGRGGEEEPPGSAFPEGIRGPRPEVGGGDNRHRRDVPGGCAPHLPLLPGEHRGGVHRPVRDRGPEAAFPGAHHKRGEGMRRGAHRAPRRLRLLRRHLHGEGGTTTSCTAKSVSSWGPRGPTTSWSTPAPTPMPRRGTA